VHGDAQLASAWIAAARREEVAHALEAVYAMVADQIEARGPACWASGRCCNFERTGHRLYVTGLEAAYTVTRMPGMNLAPLTAAAIDGALSRGDCPLLAQNLCTAHTIKPLGCRVYFCDRSAQTWQQDLSERAGVMIRAIHNRHGIEYRYAEWRALLGLVAAGFSTETQRQ
jgi:Fe-S-cluster containining protein